MHDNPLLSQDTLSYGKLILLLYHYQTGDSTLILITTFNLGPFLIDHHVQF